MVDRAIRRVVWRKPAAAAAAAPPPVAPAHTDDLLAGAPAFDIAPTDPILLLLQSATGAVELGNLELDSPALAEMRAAGITLVVPLVTNGELIGLLNVGPRLSDQGYSPDDRRLLETLGAQAAPARPRRPARPRAGDRDSRARPARAGAAGRSADPAELPAQARCPSSPAGRWPRSTGRPARSAVTSTTSSSCPTGASGSSSAT